MNCVSKSFLFRNHVVAMVANDGKGQHQEEFKVFSRGISAVPPNPHKERADQENMDVIDPATLLNGCLICVIWYYDSA